MHEGFYYFLFLLFFIVSSVKYDINHTVSFSLRSAIKCARARKHTSDTLVFLQKYIPTAVVPQSIRKDKLIV